MEFTDLSFEEQVQVKAMQEAYNYNLPVSAVRTVYFSIRKAAEENHVELCSSLRMRVNDIIMALASAYDGKNAFVLQCEEIDKKCFDVMYKQHVARDFFVQELIQVIISNPSVTIPSVYVKLLNKNNVADSGKQSFPEQIKAAVSSISAVSSNGTVSIDGVADDMLFLSRNELLNRIQEISESEFELCSSREEMLYLFREKISECAVRRIGAF